MNKRDRVIIQTALASGNKDYAARTISVMHRCSSMRDQLDLIQLANAFDLPYQMVNGCMIADGVAA
jgi:hypothetical protein